MAGEWKKHEVVPDVIDTAPSEVAKITYEGDVCVNLGNELTPTQVKNKPSIDFSAEANTFYTLCMTGETILNILIQNIFIEAHLQNKILRY